MSILHTRASISRLFIMTWLVIAYLQLATTMASHLPSNEVNNNNNNNNNKHCTEPDDADLEKLYVKMLSSAEFHESLSQVQPLRHVIHKRAFGNPGEDICDNKTTIPSADGSTSRSSLCPWGTVMYRNKARYPRAIREVLRDPRASSDMARQHLCEAVEGRRQTQENHGCEALVFYIRVLWRTEQEDSEGKCRYVPGWHQQTVAWIPTAV